MDARTRSDSDRSRYSATAGAIAGGAAAWITSPIEIVRTRLQSSTHQYWARTGHPALAAAKSIVRHEGGVLALWKGSGVTVVGFAASKAIYFGLYGASRDALMPCTFVGVAAVAAACSAVSVTLTCPIWMLKTTLQLQGHPGRLGSAVRCLRPFGVRGLFKGLTASYLGIGESALQLALYEYGRAAAGPQWTPVTVVVSKVVACAVMYPHEVLRTRMRQLDDTAGLRLGVVSTARRIVAREGWSALYGGMGVHMLRAVPNAMLVFGTLEAIHALNNND